MISTKNNFVTYIIFFSFFFIGITVVTDYGVSQDEYSNRIHGFVLLNYVGNLIFPDLIQNIVGDKNIQKLDINYAGKSYGAYYPALQGVFEIIFQIKDKYNQFLLRHYINFSVFFISLIFFYKTLLLLTNSKNLSLIGFLILGLSPRIFANSFYNNIDIFFLSVVLISNYFFIKLYLNLNYKNLVLCALFTALVVDHRIAGIYFLFQNLFFIFLISKKKKKFGPPFFLFFIL